MSGRLNPARLKDRRLIPLLLVGAIAGGLAVSTSPSSADVSAVKGSAFGYTLSVSLFGGPANVRGVGQVACTSPNNPPGCAPTPATSDSPAVTLPPTGGNESQTDVEGPTAQVGPAIIFSSGTIDVSTQGTLGPNGSVISSADISNVNKSGQEVFTATSLSSSCTASEGGVTATTEVVNGVVQTSEGNPDVDGDEVNVTVPTNPTPGFKIPGVIEGVGDSFEYTFNEQTVNPDGSITVYAAHMRLIGPTAVGDLYIGKSECGVTVMAGTTTTTSTAPSTSTTSTSTTSTTVPPSTTSTSSTSTTVPPTTTTTLVPPSTTSTTVPPTTTTSVVPPTTTTSVVPPTTTTSVVPPTTTTSLPPSDICQSLIARRAAANARIDAAEAQVRANLSGPALASALAQLQAARAQVNAAFSMALAAAGCPTDATSATSAASGRQAAAARTAPSRPGRRSWTRPK